MTTYSSYIFSLRSKEDMFLHLTNGDSWDQVSSIDKICYRQIRYLEFDSHLKKKKNNNNNNNWCRCHFSSLQWYFTIKPSQINIPNLTLFIHYLVNWFSKTHSHSKSKVSLGEAAKQLPKMSLLCWNYRGLENPSQLVLFSLWGKKKLLTSCFFVETKLCMHEIHKRSI